MTSWSPTVANCDNYMDERTGKYEYRRVRYLMAADTIVGHALNRGEDPNNLTVFDIGAGMTEFDYCLRTDHKWRGRYIPIDGGIGGEAHNLETWVPPRQAHWFVALEILEHLHDWERLVKVMQDNATCGIVISTPNPRTTDVLGMDPTHVVEVHAEALRDHGFTVMEETFYGGAFSNGEPDSLFGVWMPPIYEA